ncbi:MAG: hypothetical protein ACOYK6_07550 [Chthoniobacterales bacterium]
MNTSNLTQVNSNPNANPEIQESNSIVRDAAPATAPEGNLEGISLRALFPNPIAHQEMTSSLDYFMQLIGNPVRTVVAVSELHPCTDSTSVFSTSVLLPNDVAEARNNLSSFHNTLLNIEASLEGPQINRALPEYEPCRRALIKAIQSFRTAFEILNNDSKSWAQYADAITEASHDYTALANATRIFTDAQRAHSLASPPGAFHISAAEAATQGIHQYDDASRPIIEPEAVPFADATTIQFAPDHVIAKTARTPNNPDGYPVVRATLGTLAEAEIPTNQVRNLSTHTTIEALMAERIAGTDIPQPTPPP